MAVVNNLKEIRESRGLLQDDLASATGFCTKTISRVERGERAPSAWNVVNGHHPLNLCFVLQHISICLLKMYLC